ncbi:MAG: phage tail length tape measure family protein [Croceibacterium sp.]
MSAKVGSLNVDLSLETARFTKGLTDAQRQLAATQKKFATIGSTMSGIGKTMSLAVTAPIIAFGVSSIKAANESAEALGQVNAALKSMGNVSGRTSAQLQGLATNLMHQSLYDDDEILRKVTANLLTFGNVAGDNFDRAQKAAVDLAARMGTDLQAATITLGKALNDPAKGLNALRRVGIQFTEQQQEQIKSMAATGNAAGAQAIMLKELERQFGGSAQAMRDADPGAALKNSFDDLQETIGAKLLPILPAVTDAVTSVLDAFGQLSPKMQSTVIVGAGLAAALGPVLAVVGGLLPLLTKLGPVIGIVSKAMLFLAANPVILGLALVIGGIYLAWKNWDKIEPVIRRLYDGVKKWLGSALTSVLEAVLAPIHAVANGFKWLYDVVIGHSYIPDMVDGIGQHMARLEGLMVGKAKSVTQDAATEFQNLRDLIDRLFPAQAEQRSFDADIARIGRSKLTDAEKAAAVQARRFELAGVAPNATNDSLTTGLEGDFAAQPDMNGIQDMLDRLGTSLPDLSSKWGDFKDAAHEAFGVVADNLKGVLLGVESLGEAFKNVIGRLAERGLDRLFQGLEGALFGGGGGGGIGGALAGIFGGARAMGGPISAGVPYLVGERGLELVVPRMSAHVIPNHNLRGMSRGGQTIHITQNFPGVTNGRDAREAGSQMAMRLRRELNGPVR